MNTFVRFVPSFPGTCIIAAVMAAAKPGASSAEPKPRSRRGPHDDRSHASGGSDTLARDRHERRELVPHRRCRSRSIAALASHAANAFLLALFALLAFAPDAAAHEPTNLKAVRSGSNEITISWMPPSNSDSPDLIYEYAFRWPGQGWTNGSHVLRGKTSLISDTSILGATFRIRVKIRKRPPPGGELDSSPSGDPLDYEIYGDWVQLPIPNDAERPNRATTEEVTPPPGPGPSGSSSGGGGSEGGGGGLPPANTPATGAPTISGTAQVGATLTASAGTVADADGLTGVSYSWQWIRVWAGGAESDIAGATNATYLITDADLGRSLKVRASFADDAGNAERLTSAATATVVANNVRTVLVNTAVRSTLAAVALRSVSSALDNIGPRFAASVPASGNVERTCAPDAAMGDAKGRDGCDPAAQSRTAEASELQDTGEFSLTLGTAEGPGMASSPLWSVWGRGDLGSFAGRPEPGMRYEGGLRTGWLGVDARAGPWVAGIALSYGTGEGEYSSADDGASGPGRLETTLTALHPYGRWTAPDGLELRGVLGVGRGEALLWPEGGDREASDLSMWMGTVGVRRPLPAIARFDLAARGDASIARMETGDGPENVDGLTADSWRLRAGVEASRTVTLGEDAALTPFVEAAVRHDGGDGLAGTGVEIAGGLRYTAPRLLIEARGRWLATHTDEGARESGVSVTARMGPGAHGRGLALALNPRWGAADTGGAEALWRDELPQPAGLSTREAAAMDASVSYGVRVVPHGLLTPFAETGLAGVDGRRLAFGTRYETSRMDLDVELAGERREDGAADPENLIRLDLGLRF